MLQPNLVGKSQLIEWVNKTLDLNYKKVEECANGAAFCQIIDAIYPGSVPMNRVDFGAQLQHQNFENYKVLQEAFIKNGITQYIDVENLSAGKYMAVLEMLQWIYQYYEANKPSQPYDPQSRRHSKSRSIPKPSGRNLSTKSSVRKTDSPSHSGPQATIPSRKGTRTPNSSVSKTKNEVPIEPSPSDEKLAQENAAMSADIAELKAKIKELKAEVKKSKEDYEEMIQERDFYYDKLRRVEDFCQDHEDDENINSVLAILYETDEKNGFLPPEEEDQ